MFQKLRQSLHASLGWKEWEIFKIRNHKMENNCLSQKSLLTPRHIFLIIVLGNIWAWKLWLFLPGSWNLIWLCLKLSQVLAWGFLASKLEHLFAHSLFFFFHPHCEPHTHTPTPAHKFFFCVSLVAVFGVLVLAWCFLGFISHYMLSLSLVGFSIPPRTCTPLCFRGPLGPSYGFLGRPLLITLLTFALPWQLCCQLSILDGRSWAILP